MDDKYFNLMVYFEYDGKPQGLVYHSDQVNENFQIGDFTYLPFVQDLLEWKKIKYKGKTLTLRNIYIGTKLDNGKWKRLYGKDEDIINV